MNKSSKFYQHLPFLFIWFAVSTFTSNDVTAKVDNNLAQQKLIESVKGYINEKLGQNIHTQETTLNISVSPIDSRIQIPECPTNMRFSASEESLQQSNITVKASCEDSEWYLYMMVKAQRMQKVVVLSRAVGPGTILNEQNLSVVKMDKNKLRRTTFANISDVVGARIKKRMRVGQAIDPKQLCFVCKGDNILIVASAGELKIKTTGIAQQDGNIGDTIGVRNSSSKKLVYAQVINTRQVMVQI